MTTKVPKGMTTGHQVQGCLAFQKDDLEEAKRLLQDSARVAADPVLSSFCPSMELLAKAESFGRMTN